jgi:hypothetical protein
MTVPKDMYPSKKMISALDLKYEIFDCDWFDSKNKTRQNQFSMVEVKHNERL